MKNNLYISAILASILFSGCSIASKGAHEQKDKEILSEKIDSNRSWASNKNYMLMNEIFKIKKDDNISIVTSALSKIGYNIIIDENIHQEDYVFKQDLNFLRFDELLLYINKIYKPGVSLEKISDNMFFLKKNGINKIITEKREEVPYKSVNLSKKIELNGEYTLQEIWEILSNENIKIEFLFLNKDNLSKTIPSYSGTIGGLIDFMVQQKSLIKKEKENKIEIYDAEVRIFDLKLPTVQLVSKDDMKNLVSDTIKPLEDLKKDIESVAKEAKININPSNGTVTVTADPLTLSSIEKIIDNHNKIYGISVHIEVHIHEVMFNKDDALGIDYSKLAGRLGDLGWTVNMVSSKTMTVTDNSLGFNYGGKSDVNNAIFKFLNTYGDAKILNEPSVETANNLPVIMKIMNKRDIVADTPSALATTANNSATTTQSGSSITKETIESGFAIALYPKVNMETGKISIAMKPIMTSIKEITPFSYGSKESPQTAMLKNIDIKDFTQIVNLEPNQITILGGYRNIQNNGQKNTMPFMNDKDNLLDVISGTKEAKESKSELIMTIRAYIKE